MLKPICIATAVFISIGLNNKAWSAPIGVDAFVGATIERFNGPYVNAKTYDFENGMTYLNRGANPSDNINLRADMAGCAPLTICSTYGMGLIPEITWGVDGVGDGYFGTSGPGSAPTFLFSSGVTKFGFYGAEAIVPGSTENSGVFSVRFLGLGDSIIDEEFIVSSQSNAWKQFHGYEFAAPVYRVEFTDTGSVALDSLQFISEQKLIPEPGTLGLLAAAALAFFARSKTLVQGGRGACG